MPTLIRTSWALPALLYVIVMTVYVPLWLCFWSEVLPDGYEQERLESTLEHQLLGFFVMPAHAWLTLAYALDPSDVDTQDHLAYTHAVMGKVRFGLADPEGAFTHYQAAQLLSENLATRYPDNVELQRHRAMLYYWEYDAFASFTLEDDLAEAALRKAREGFLQILSHGTPDLNDTEWLQTIERDLQALLDDRAGLTGYE